MNLSREEKLDAIFLQAVNMILPKYFMTWNDVDFLRSCPCGNIGFKTDICPRCGNTKDISGRVLNFKRKGMTTEEKLNFIKEVNLVSGGQVK